MKFLSLLMFLAASAAAVAGDSPQKPQMHKLQFTGEYYTDKQVTVLPKPEKRVPPRYPKMALRAERSGAARVAFIVNEKGFTEELQVVEATDKSFGEAAVEAIAKWKFTPGEINGRPVRVVVWLDVPFTLNVRR